MDTAASEAHSRRALDLGARYVASTGFSGPSPDWPIADGTSRFDSYFWMHELPIEPVVDWQFSAMIDEGYAAGGWIRPPETMEELAAQGDLPHWLAEAPAMTIEPPRAVFGLPALQSRGQAARDARFLLGQTPCRRSASLFPMTVRPMRRWPIVADTPRGIRGLSTPRTEARLGYIANARRCVALAREKFPKRVLRLGKRPRRLAPGLARSPHRRARHASGGRARRCRLVPHRGGWDDRARRVEDDLDTTSITSVRKRLRATFNGMSAGNMVYGLFRSRRSRRPGSCAGSPDPDRLLLTELALYGPFVAVPEFLWYRRYRKTWSRERQIAASFLGEPPRHIRYLWWASPQGHHAGAARAKWNRRGQNPHSRSTSLEGKRLALTYASRCCRSFSSISAGASGSSAATSGRLSEGCAARVAADGRIGCSRCPACGLFAAASSRKSTG